MRPWLIVGLAAVLLGVVALARIARDDVPRDERVVAPSVSDLAATARVGALRDRRVPNPVHLPRLTSTLAATRARPATCTTGSVRMELDYAPVTLAAPNTPDGAITRFLAIPLAAGLSATYWRPLRVRRTLARYRILNRLGRPIGTARVGLEGGTQWHVVSLRTCNR